ncbi:hypothetical protein AX16_005228 [Volvariella volvacea WC 439]|nr:hypothetical protein AX16_005228 [Volvariella volvacea WC 439]
MTSEIREFCLNVPDETYNWIRQRVDTARVIPDIQHPEGKEWDYGTPTSTMEDLVHYWRTEYDWRAVEKHINQTFKMFTVDLEESGEVITLHFVHHRSGEEGAVPLLFAHGWPGNFLEVEHLLSLTKREDPKQQAFHIVAPTIPGFVFSSSPKRPGFGVVQIAAIYHKLMLKLGYSHYIAQAGDWGSLIIRSVAIQYPEACVGIHINFPISNIPSFLKNPITCLWLFLRWFTPDEKKKLGRLLSFRKTEMGYQQIQSTKPQTISYGLLDSPIGMLAWIREKLELPVGPGFELPKDLPITWTMLYLLSNSAGHARLYKEGVPKVNESILSKKVPGNVAMGVSCFPYDVAYIPEWWGRATLGDNIVLWKEHSEGGHFPSVECPELLKADIREFVEKIHGNRWKQLIEAGK